MPGKRSFVPQDDVRYAGAFSDRPGSEARMRHFYVYIMTNVSRTLYIGMTNNLERRVWEHKQKKISGFTSKYNITRLVYIETYDDALSAIEREKQLKGYLRSKKVALVEHENPDWLDLSDGWYDQ